MGGTSDPPEPCPLVKTPIQRHRRQPGSPAPLPHHPDTNINLAGAVPPPANPPPTGVAELPMLIARCMGVTQVKIGMDLG